MATIKSYTDLEQSEKLAEILPVESADMVYFGIHQGMDGKYYTSGTNTEDDVVPIYKNFCIKVFAKITESDVINQLPCWSLAALLGLMPTDEKKDEYYVDTESHSDYYTVSYRNCWDGCIHSEYSKESLLDAAYEMVVWLKENKKL